MSQLLDDPSRRVVDVPSPAADDEPHIWADWPDRLKPPVKFPARWWAMGIVVAIMLIFVWGYRNNPEEMKGGGYLPDGELGYVGLVLLTGLLGVIFLWYAGVITADWLVRGWRRRRRSR